MAKNKYERYDELEKVNNQLSESIELMRKRYGTATEIYFDKLKNLGVDMDEERILRDYAQVKDAEKLNAVYCEKYGEILDGNHGDSWLNSDVFMELMDRIIPEHFNIAETGDLYFIGEEINDLCSEDLRKADQKQIEQVLKALVTYSKTRDHHTLEDTLEFLELNGLLKEFVRACHNRTPAFRSLVRELYECYEDMDPMIFHAVYKEFIAKK